MSTLQPVDLATMPAEVTLAILANLPNKRDWLSLARSCRRISNVVAAELARSSVGEDKEYSLWHACVHGNLDIVRRHIAHDPTVVNFYFTSAFFQPNKLRLERNRRPFSENILPRTVPLAAGWYASKQPLGENMTPLTVAIIAGKYPIVQELLANGADPNLPDLKPIMASKTWLRRYPIHWAVLSKSPSSLPIIEALGKHSANMNQVEADMNQTEADNGPSPGRLRGEKCAPIFLLLTLQKPRPNASRARRPTSCEAFNGDFQRLQALRVQQLRVLLQSGADPNQKYDGRSVTPILFLLSSLYEYLPSFYFSSRFLQLRQEEEDQAVIVNKIVISFLETLHSFGAKINKLGGIFLNRELEHRSLSEEEDISVYEVDYRSDEEEDRVTIVTHYMPLHVACRLSDSHKKPIISWFIVNGARTDKLTGEGTTMLMEYCKSNFADMTIFENVLKIRDHPHVNFVDKRGRTALHHLCGNYKISPGVKESAIQLMLDMGANPTLPDAAGVTPVQEITMEKSSAFRFDRSIKTLETASGKWKVHKRKCTACGNGRFHRRGGQLIGPRPDNEDGPLKREYLIDKRGSLASNRGSSTPGSSSRGAFNQDSSNLGSSAQNSSNRASLASNRASLASNRGSSTQGSSNRGAPSRASLTSNRGAFNQGSSTQGSSNQGPSNQGPSNKDSSGQNKQTVPGSTKHYGTARGGNQLDPKRPRGNGRGGRGGRGGRVGN